MIKRINRNIEDRILGFVCLGLNVVVHTLFNLEQGGERLKWERQTIWIYLVILLTVSIKRQIQMAYHPNR